MNRFHDWSPENRQCQKAALDDHFRAKRDRGWWKVLLGLVAWASLIILLEVLS